MNSPQKHVLKLGLIGNPVVHSVSPEMFGLFSHFSSLELDYRIFELPTDERFTAGFRELIESLDGVNVTIPFKERVIPLLDSLDKPAEITGAVNVIYRKNGKLIGTNTDSGGFHRALQANKISPVNTHCFIIGNGGAARAVVYALFGNGVHNITIVSRSRQRFNNFRDHLTRSLPGLELTFRSLQDFSVPAIPQENLIINCTPCGSFPDIRELCFNPPADARNIRFFDLIYNPPETAAMKAVKSAGGDTVGGLDMLIFQGLEALKIWTGREISSAAVIQRIKQALTEYLKTKFRQPE